LSQCAAKQTNRCDTQLICADAVLSSWKGQRHFDLPVECGAGRSAPGANSSSTGRIGNFHRSVTMDDLDFTVTETEAAYAAVVLDQFAEPVTLGTVAHH
jgi:hypothetical protein